MEDGVGWYTRCAFHPSRALVSKYRFKCVTTCLLCFTFITFQFYVVLILSTWFNLKSSYCASFSMKPVGLFLKVRWRCQKCFNDVVHLLLMFSILKGLEVWWSGSLFSLAEHTCEHSSGDVPRRHVLR